MNEEEGAFFAFAINLQFFKDIFILIRLTMNEEEGAQRYFYTLLIRFYMLFFIYFLLFAYFSSQHFNSRRQSRVVHQLPSRARALQTVRSSDETQGYM